MIIQNGVGITTLLNGNTVKQALNPANETVNRGIYNATTLSAVDADLAAANIALAITIFGFLGTVVPGGTETIEVVSCDTLGAGVNYTPGVSGIFFMVGGTDTPYEVFSTAQTAWYRYVPAQKSGPSMAVGDGSNLRFLNDSVGNTKYNCNRHYMSTGTYQRLRDTTLNAGVTYTPAAGFVTLGSDSADVKLRANKDGTWLDCKDADHSVGPQCGNIADGANIRVENTGGVQHNYVLMHATMT